MGQQYDVSLKALFLHKNEGIIHRLLFGGRITEFLPTEQPQVSNRRADLVVRTENGEIHHVEFQTANEPGFALRMLEYYAYGVRTYSEHVTQTVLYLGREPMRLEARYQSPSMDFRYEIVNLREWDAVPLLESPDWTDNVLALLAKGSPEKALEAVIPRIARLQSEERDLAGGVLILLSGILDLEATVQHRLQEIGMIDVMQNKVLGPMIEERIRQREEIAERRGRQDGLRDDLRLLLETKFGPISKETESVLAEASGENLRVWFRQALTADTIEQALRPQ